MVNVQPHNSSYTNNPAGLFANASLAEIGEIISLPSMHPNAPSSHSLQQINCRINQINAEGKIISARFGSRIMMCQALIGLGSALAIINTLTKSSDSQEPKSPWPSLQATSIAMVVTGLAGIAFATIASYSDLKKL